jgi:uncharacterized membrane protein YhaH (DUF805 family)
LFNSTLLESEVLTQNNKKWRPETTLKTGWLPKNLMSRYNKKEIIMNWYLAVLKNYFGFSGRARRKEYWMFVLFNIIFFIVAMIIDNVFGTTIEGLPYGLFYFLYALAIIIPALAVAVRRLHDVGKSGWFLFIALIPIVGAIWLLVLYCTDGNAGANKYGANPKEIA